ncbi:two component system sensor kinase [Actinoplanes friuliensis DSM 7358]|uniref:histidine kinase n=1 Tax=Actinoplanes friuliensis DSM 7358 TaxID=1246995 RepID=U5WB39_9ACTN|nr:two component system sensor kinase [Actinoplanes friuliensis DSM 7358]
MVGVRRALDRGSVLAGAAALAAGLSVVNLWWAVPAAVAAFLVGLRPGRARSTVLAFVALLSAGVVLLSFVPAWLPWGSRFVAVVVVATMVPWFAGRFWGQYRELVRAGWERAAQLEREQQLVAERARLRERARIAMDMHDVLGHDLSLIALSAGALKLAPGLEEQHQEAAGHIRARAAAAVERLGEVIGVLREETTPGLANLTAEAAESGLAVELHVDGEADGLSPGVERAAQRVVQEALTNVAKHAPDAKATVRVTHARSATTVVVENGPPSGGRGLVGLAERVRSAGGTFRYGPSNGGFEVAASIPHAGPSPLPSPDRDNEHRHRVRRILAAAVMVPLVTGALLSGALMGWEMLSSKRSVLDPGDYARLRVGQNRAEVARFLPDRQTNHRPLTAEPTGDDLSCEYYAMTADRFDDRSGDAYRVCFRQDVLVSLDTLTP